MSSNKLTFNLDRSSTGSTEEHSESLCFYLSCPKCADNSLEDLKNCKTLFSDPMVSDDFFARQNSKVAELLNYLSEKIPNYSVQESVPIKPLVSLSIGNSLLRRRREKVDK